ncbi:hypothetical protein XELAEV_18007982mg [Xenopus laevis]|uniref:Uncharacterized protein n=1 Tax=Xenopus laevis TaxID=8355 RepID=A0A974E2X4_XENLA|nr:hypothetical protein XELAEV_18007982mg [Xenopus laevis]
MCFMEGSLSLNLSLRNRECLTFWRIFKLLHNLIINCAESQPFYHPLCYLCFVIKGYLMQVQLLQTLRTLFHE